MPSTRPARPMSAKPATISYAASSALAKQIEEGAPADVFISADLDWMKYLSDKKLTKPDTEVKLLGNHIVLVAPEDSKVETKIEKGFDLAGLLGDGKLAMGDCQGGAGRQIRQGGAGIARRLGLGRGQGGAGRECARRAEAGLDRRSAARHRLSDRRQRRARASRSSAPSRRIRTRRSSIRSPRPPIPRTTIRRPS